MSALVNVSSGLPCDIRIAPYASCERTLLLEHLDVLEHGDVVVLDRGYPSHKILRHLIAKGVDFLVRVPTSSTFEVIDWLREARGDDYRVIIKAPRDATKGTGDTVPPKTLGSVW